MIEISKVRAADLPELAVLYEELLGKPTDTDAMQTNYAIVDANPDYMLIGAKIDGVLAGTLMGIVCTDLSGDGSPFMVLENVVVKNEFKRLGVGKAMMEYIEGYARSRYCCIVEFVSSMHRTQAHQFYESCGYQPDMAKGFRKFL